MADERRFRVEGDNFAVAEMRKTGIRRAKLANDPIYLFKASSVKIMVPKRYIDRARKRYNQVCEVPPHRRSGGNISSYKKRIWLMPGNGMQESFGLSKREEFQVRIADPDEFHFRLG